MVAAPVARNAGSSNIGESDRRRHLIEELIEEEQARVNPLTETLGGYAIRNRLDESARCRHVSFDQVVRSRMFLQVMRVGLANSL